MMSRSFFAAALLVISALSLAPQAQVCGTVQKHACTCCDEGGACTCCDIVPLYPDQAAAAASVPHIAAPDSWTPIAAGANPTAGTALSVPSAVERIHGPPPLQQTSQLRI